MNTAHPTTPTTARHRTRRTAATALALGLLAAGIALPTTAANADPLPTSAEPTGSTMTISHDGSRPAASTAELDTIGTLILRRLELADPVAESKWLSGKPVADPVREQAVVDEAVTLAEQRGVDPVLVTRVIRAQIAASKVVQRGLINHWTHNPWTAPTTAPDLTTIRPQLDAIDTDLVTALGQAQTVAQDHRCAHLVDAERKHLDVGLDSLHRKGIDVAWHTFCAA